MPNIKPLVEAYVLTAPPPKRVELHKKICEGMSDLYERKNHDYGNSFAQLRCRRPDSILTRLYDKYLRLESLLDQPDKAKVKDESVEDTLRDLANYCIMELIERQLEREAVTSFETKKGVVENEQ